ncbi:unnamed protein product [Zymoseptoria tritici ST99CH_1E4]|uniref:Uncharacterized protein n=1 Tax=Zymoseptoria tritici ST99CH_1E4 TaxID=1276532 RepID=A0A2H1GIV7_ZYMTR|nr:unnamed protein product [Zymoseptoria tritici ST99CH_1E4]
MRSISLLLWALAASSVTARRGWGGECQTQDDCCKCDPGSKCLLSCIAVHKHPSTTGKRCLPGSEIDCEGAPSDCHCF